MKFLIGHSGFVGETLKRQTHFDALFRSNNIEQIADRTADLIVCAGAPSQKWIANRDPATDKASIARLITALHTVNAAYVVLISTVDVFTNPLGVDEDSPIDTAGLQPYGLHRYQLEQAVKEQFEHHLIVRLTGLVGEGLRKNALYDLKHRHQLNALDARAHYQFYPMQHLWRDIGRAREAGLQLAHFNAEPLPLGTVAQDIFAIPLADASNPTPARYDLHTRHASTLGSHGRYLYDASASLAAIRAYATNLQEHG
jgi:nucleoside-diphosphate-sugar epimerase